MPVYVDWLCGYTLFIHVTLASFYCLHIQICILGWSLISFLWIKIGSTDYIGEKGRVGVRGKNKTVSKAVISSRESVRVTGSLFTWIYSEYKYLCALFSLFISCGLLAVYPTIHPSCSDCLLHFWSQAPPFTAQPYIHHGKARSRLRPGWGWRW